MYCNRNHQLPWRRVPRADCTKSHGQRECSVILTHQRARPLNLNRFQLLCRMQLNLFLISASAKEQNFPADFNLTQAAPASAQTVFSTNIQSRYSPTLQLYFLILIFNNGSPLPAGSLMSPLPWGERPSSFLNDCMVSLTPFC